MIICLAWHRSVDGSRPSADPLRICFRQVNDGSQTVGRLAQRTYQVLRGWNELLRSFSQISSSMYQPKQAINQFFAFRFFGELCRSLNQIVEHLVFLFEDFPCISRHHTDLLLLGQTAREQSDAKCDPLIELHSPRL